MIVLLEDVSKSFGIQEVLTGINAKIDDDQRVGLIGVNGAGKSTLLNIIYNELSADGGTVARGSGKTYGFLRQNSGLNESNTVKTEMRSVFAKLDQMAVDMRHLEEEMSQVDSSTTKYKEISAHYASLQLQYETSEGYDIQPKIDRILYGMGFGGDDREKEIGVLSGGEKTRLAICKLLLEAPNLLILDEPTNHLDFPTLIWLEDYLSTYKGALLIVSHDRFFLDRLCGTIWDLENHRLTTYKGNYTKYLVQKEEKQLYQQKEYDKQQEEIASHKDFIARNLVRASTTKRAQSREKALERMDKIDAPKPPPKPPSIRFQVKREPVSDVLILEDIALSVGTDDHKQLFSGLNLHMKKGEKIALVGHNGIGKSSLLKALQKRIPIDTGKITWGRNTDVAYFEQGEGEMDGNKTVMQELWDDFPRAVENTIRSTLGHAGLRREEVFKQVKNLSGGERARLKFAKLMLLEGNVLLLDEPTNHLDLATKEVLDSALEQYEGTLLVVSHDRYLLNKFPHKIIEMQEDGVVIYEGKYDDYAEKKKAQQELDNQQSSVGSPKEEQPKPNTSYRSKEQRKQSAARRKRLTELESEIELLEEEVDTLEHEISLPAVSSDYEVLQEKCSALEEKKTKLNNNLEEWTELGETE